MRSQPIPNAGMILFNLREVLDKCKNECGVLSDLWVLSGNIIFEQNIVHSCSRCIDILGITPMQVAIGSCQMIVRQS
jgi:hypothetical protein